jgi:4a-hydroxytetrahydrobiopterin dehydratase
MSNDRSEGVIGACAACRGELPVLDASEIAPLHRRLDPRWTVLEGRRLERAFDFPDFREALAFAGRVGDAAESLAHHPELHVSWGRVRVTIWTYKVRGLTQADFELAETVDRLTPGPFYQGKPP